MKPSQNKVRKILQEFKKEAEKIFGDKFAGLILFGSFARGEASSDSDLDLLLLVRKKLTKKEDEKLSELSVSLSLKYDLLITCFPYPEKAYQSWETPFLMNVRKEGVWI